MDHGEPARVADGLDLPGDPRRALALGFLAPVHVHRLDEPSRRLDDEVLAFGEWSVSGGVFERVVRTGRPVGLDPGAEVVLGPDRRVGDRLPQALGRCADVDLEDFLHRLLHFGLEADQAGRPRLGELAHPAVVDEPDRDWVEVVQLLASTAPAHDEARLLEQAQMLGHGDAGHGVRCCQRDERLTVLLIQGVQERSSGRICKRPKHHIHSAYNREPYGFLSRS